MFDDDDDFDEELFCAACGASLYGEDPVVRPCDGRYVHSGCA